MKTWNSFCPLLITYIGILRRTQTFLYQCRYRTSYRLRPVSGSNDENPSWVITWTISRYVFYSCVMCFRNIYYLGESSKQISWQTSFQSFKRSCMCKSAPQIQNPKPLLCSTHHRLPWDFHRETLQYDGF